MFDKFHFSRRRFLKAAAIAAAAGSLPSFAQTGFPRGPIRLIVGLPPGGSADVIARAVARAMEVSMKHPVVVDNRPGGMFNLSVQGLLNAPADGHTLLYMYSGYLTVQATHNMFDLDRDTIPVTEVATTPIVLMVRADAPFKTLQDLIAYTRKNPQKLNYGSLGHLSLEHLLMAQIEQAAGVKWVNIPYKGGPDVAKALMAGEVDLAVLPAIFIKTLGSTGRLRPLALLEGQRHPMFPTIPTLAEAGVRLSPVAYWGGIVARAGTPPDIIQRLHKEITTAIRQKDVMDTLDGTANYPAPSHSPEAFRKFMQSELAWMRAAVKGIDVKE